MEGRQGRRHRSGPSRFERAVSFLPSSRQARANEALVVISELFFADTSSLLGAMDLRTGKLLYAYPSQTSTAHSLLPLPTLSAYKKSRFDKEKRDRVGLVTLSSDATLRACSTTAPPEESKKNVTRGEVLGMIGGVGSGGFGYYGSTEMEELEDEEEEVAADKDGEAGEEGDEEEVWDDMAVVEEDEGMGSDDDEDEDAESSEDEAPQKKRKGGKR